MSHYLKYVLFPKYFSIFFTESSTFVWSENQSSDFDQGQFKTKFLLLNQLDRFWLNLQYIIINKQL